MKNREDNWFERLMLNEKFIFAVIFINAVTIFVHETIGFRIWLYAIDMACTLVFLAEMIIKHQKYGLKGYWSDGWNRLDGILVILSLPSLVMLFVPFGMIDLSVLLILRVLRVLKFFRVVHFFPSFSNIAKNFILAMRQSYAFLLCYLVIIVIFGMINCSIFKDLVPKYFGTPLDSIYSVFRLFTVEGWYDIPDSIAVVTSPFWGKMIRLYFCLLLLMGGVIGMSFINSIFVDAMVSDNNDDVKAQLAEMEKKLDKLLEEKGLDDKD